MTDPTGATAPRPDAAQRTDLPATPVSEHRAGGLLAIGTDVEVTVLGDNGYSITGVIVDTASVPAPYLSIVQRGNGRRVVVFTGPGVIVEHALPPHPGLGE